MENKSINERVSELIGDTPVSVQLNYALDKMADKDHTHDDYVPKSDFEELKKIVETLVDLVGDTPVSAQIYAAIQNRG